MLDWLLQNTIVAATLLGGVAVCARFLRSRPALLHVAWLLVIARLVVPPLPLTALWAAQKHGQDHGQDHGQGGPGAGPLLSFWVGADEGGAGSSAASYDKSAPGGEGAAGVDGTFFFASGTATGPGPLRLLGALRSERLAPWRAAALWVWLLGAALVLARELRGTRRVRRLVRDARPAGPEVLARVRAVARELGVRAPRVRLVGGLRAPFVCGLARPVLLLDPSRARAPRSVLAHELAHLGRRDHWASWLEVAALCLHWWNPVLHLARARMRRAMELACDAWVVRHYPEERLVYARALLAAAADGGGAALPQALGALGPTGRAFEERLAQILHSDAEARVPRLATLLIVLLAVPLAADWAAALGAPAAARTDPGIARMLAGFGVESWEELEARSRAELGARAGQDPFGPRGDPRGGPPERGESFKNLGLALLARGAWSEGVGAFRAQIERGFQPEGGRYNLACAHARRGDADAAFALLRGLLARGALDVRGVVRDPDLRSLAADPRWSALTALAAAPAGP